MTLIDGRPVDCLPVQDRGLHYGDGLFETLAARDGQLLCWKEHFARLAAGCERLGMACPPQALLEGEARELATGNGHCVVKIILTRGQGGRGYLPPEPARPARIVARYPWPGWPEEYRAEGVIVRYCRIRLGINAVLAGLKHLNRLEQVLARNEWRDPAIAEGLMQDTQDNVIEGTMSNLFLISGQKLLTPDLDQCGVAGVIRHRILTVAPALGLETVITLVSRDDLSAADEIFLCNSVIGVWPIRRLADRDYRPGTWTARIRETLANGGMIAE